MGREYEVKTKVVEQSTVIGDEMLNDDFSGPMRWSSIGDGAEELARVTDEAFEGVASMFLATRTSGAASGDTAEARREISMPPQRKLVFKTRFLVNSVTPVGLITFRLLTESLQDANARQAEVRLDTANQNIEVRTGVATFVTIGSLGANPYDQDAWMNIEFAVDLDTGEYLYVLFNSRLLNTAGQSIFEPNAAITEFARAAIEIETTSAARDFVHIDNVQIRPIET